MVGCRTIDILLRAEKCHENLSRFYEGMAQDQRRDDVKLLLDYMSRHEEFIAKCIHEYKKGAPKGVLDAWFKYSPPTCTQRCLEDLDIQPDMTPDEVIAMALHLDRCLTNLYKELAALTHSHELLETLNDLIAMEQRDEVRLMGMSPAD